MGPKPIFKFSFFRLFLLLCLVSSTSVFFVNCSSNSNNGDSAPAPTPGPTPPPGPTNNGSYTYKRISPSGGFISSVAYRPNQVSEVWISGDDSSGLYRSQNGGTDWQLITSAPLDMSSYALTFDPNDGNIIYAPDHFGRGLIKSIDGGTSWQTYVSGLPSDNNSSERINDLAIDPNSSQTIYMALTGGLYKSTNGGQSFSQISSSVFTNNSDQNFLSVKIQKLSSSTSQIFLGSRQGRVYKGTNGGTSWIELTAAAYPVGGACAPVTECYYSVTDMAVTNNALYVAFSEGTIIKTTTYNTNSFSYVNNAPGGGAIETGMWTKIKAVSGTNASTDQLFIGTTYKAGSSKWGFFYSANGGTTLQKRVTGLNNSSTFSLAVNPADSNEVIMGTINNGIFKSTNQGVSWFSISQTVQATDSLAFLEDPTDANHLLMSSTAGLDGTSKVFESTSGGSSWSEVSFFSDKSVRSLLMPQNNSNVVIAGTHRKGIYKTTTGVNGTWTQVNSADVIFNTLQKDNANNNVLYASAYEPEKSTALGTYVSVDGGTSWTRRLTFPVVEVFPHPSSSGVAVAVTAEVFGTTDSFASTVNGLGLQSFVNTPDEFFFSAAFLPGASTLLVGSSKAKLYKSTNFNPAGTGMTWQSIPLPTTNVFIKSIVVVDAQTWYLAAFSADIHVKPDSTPGILRTTDGGKTWEFLNTGLSPSRLVFRLHPSAHKSNLFYLGMWGAGLLTLIF